MGNNLVPMPPQGLIVALQWWEGDQAQAMRLARLIADIQGERRDDVTIAFVRRFDVPESAELWATRMHVGFKFPTMSVRARREDTGHPAGCNALWSSCMEQFSAMWRSGNLHAHSIFTCEPDGVPLRVDWLDRLLEAHRRTLDEGKRITGPLMQSLRHLNGSLISHLSVWSDRPSLHHTPTDQGFDLFHSHVLMSEGRGDPWLKNVYGECDWSDKSLFAMSHETAWLASQKCSSAISWAERNLVASSPVRRRRKEFGCFCPDPERCRVDACRCKCDACQQIAAPDDDASGDEIVHPRIARAAVH